MQENLYEILGVAENASPTEIKNAYRKLAVQHHPDKGGDEEMFKKISGAYEILSDPQKKSQYDNRKNNPYGGTPFEDLFSQMFGGNPFGGGNPFEQRRPQAPSKVVKVMVSPVESYLGVEKTINYIKEKHCHGCNGSGGERKKCTRCGGSGVIIKQFGTGFMIQQVQTHCDGCGGKGFILSSKCNICGGKTTISEPQEIKVKLPNGVDNGQFLKLQGMGDFVNGMYGDLIIQVELEQRDGFEKINNDLVYNLYLDLNTIQKSTFSIPHPHGELNMTAPKTVDTSKPLRLRGKGYNGGDMYVKLHLKFERV